MNARPSPARGGPACAEGHICEVRQNIVVGSEDRKGVFAAPTGALATRDRYHAGPGRGSRRPPTRCSACSRQARRLSQIGSTCRYGSGGGGTCRQRPSGAACARREPRPREDRGPGPASVPTHDRHRREWGLGLPQGTERVQFAASGRRTEQIGQRATVDSATIAGVSEVFSSRAGNAELNTSTRCPAKLLHPS